ncbi:copper resistance protein CopC [Agromyces fucosus]|uniref:Copper resistance protein CopC n=1 Tax=Agromyces fucosus TaxID=41985 RepID=A0A4Q2JMS4_9MICO|nr:copper resistance CopC family protein [Agromyces fucosus]RXZ47430.1 copper resistance protein CopC [Agromyces fucosus]
MNNPNSVTTATALDARESATRLRTLVLAASALTVAVGITLAGASPAFAHDELLASSPEPGEVFDTAPAEVALDFSNDIIEVGTAIVVVDHHGGDVEVGDPVVAGAHVTAALPTDLEGDYQVRWRAVSSDGHPIEGTIDFGVGADATGVWTEEAPHDDSATEEEPAEGDHAEGDHAEGDDAAQSGPDGWAVAGFVVGGLGILALLAAVILNAKRKSAGPGSGSGDGAGNASGDGTGNGGGAPGTGTGSGTSGDDA